MSDIPTHIVARPGDGKAMCGSKDTPVIWQARVGMHAESRRIVLCEECETIMDSESVIAGAGVIPTRATSYIPEASPYAARADGNGSGAGTLASVRQTAQQLLDLAKAIDTRLDNVISKTARPDKKGITDMAHVAILQDDVLIIRPPGGAPVAQVTLADPNDIDAVVAALVPFLPNGNGNGHGTVTTSANTRYAITPYVGTDGAPRTDVGQAVADAIAEAGAKAPTKAPKAPRAKPAPRADGEEPRKRGRQPAISLTNLIDWLDDRPGATANEVAQAFELTAVIASRVLARAHEQGALVREGGGKRNDAYRYYTVENDEVSTDTDALAG